MKKNFILLLAIPFLFVQTIHGQAGTLDLTFNSSGYVITHFDSIYAEGYKVLAQPDGKIVACGYTYSNIFTPVNWFSAPSVREIQQKLCVSRYNADGSPDLTFGNSGKVQFNNGISS